jgi:hypothetical protein
VAVPCSASKWTAYAFSGLGTSVDKKSASALVSARQDWSTPTEIKETRSYSRFDVDLS